jgi:hypothetical protein
MGIDPANVNVNILGMLQSEHNLFGSDWPLKIELFKDRKKNEIF